MRRRERRETRWLRRAPMTCKTRHLRLSAKLRRIQRDNHLHHFACPALRQLVITIPHPAAGVRWRAREIRVDLDMTEVAAYAERRGDEVHQRKELRLRKRLQHLELWPLLAGRAGLLRRAGNGQDEREYAPIAEQGAPLALGPNEYERWYAWRA